jgi:hypothetical protein
MDFCQNCFSCEFLSTHIEVKSDKEGNCAQCGSEGVFLISASNLSDLFTPLTELYEPTGENGTPLLDLIKEDWKLFVDVPAERICLLLNEISDEQSLESFEPIIDNSDLFDWVAFKEELKHENRYFPNSFPDHQDLSNLLSYLSIETNLGLMHLYRARVHVDSVNAYTIDKMGAPPNLRASSGRANPMGIAYLYVASTLNTALSEVRPHKGDFVTIADFQVRDSLKLVDLRDPRQSIVPFIYSEFELRNIYSGLNLLETLGLELTKPISQHKAQLEYLSSQYLCEFIKSQGYDGVLYKSSLGDGDNYAIFDESNLTGIGTSVVEVTEVEINHTALN